MDAVFDQYFATHAQGCFLFDNDWRTRETHRSPFKKKSYHECFFCCDISIFPSVLLLVSNYFGKNCARDALFTFHSKLQRIHLNWPDISDIHFEKFLFYWLFFSWARFNFFLLFSFKSCRSHFHFNLFWQDFKLNHQKSGRRENESGERCNLQWDHFRYVFKKKSWCFCGLKTTSRVVNGWLNVITNGKSLLNWIDKTKTRMLKQSECDQILEIDAQSETEFFVCQNCIPLKDISIDSTLTGIHTKDQQNIECQWYSSIISYYCQLIINSPMTISKWIINHMDKLMMMTISQILWIHTHNFNGTLVFVIGVRW